MGLSMDLINGEQYSLHANSGGAEGSPMVLPVFKGSLSFSETNPFLNASWRYPFQLKLWTCTGILFRIRYCPVWKSSGRDSL